MMPSCWLEHSSGACDTAVRFYEELRTREQLGYIVSCRADRNEGVFSPLATAWAKSEFGIAWPFRSPGIVFVVQGAAKSAMEVSGPLVEVIGWPWIKSSRCWHASRPSWTRCLECFVPGVPSRK